MISLGVATQGLNQWHVDQEIPKGAEERKPMEQQPGEWSWRWWEQLVNLGIGVHGTYTLW